MNRWLLKTVGFWTLVVLASTPAFAADTVYYYHTDALHSAVVITDAYGNVVERTYYAPYGQVLNRSLRDGPGYTGQSEDPATGLVYMQQRYYDPESGRFISTDPVSVPADGGNFNRYEYANDNPYRYTDPDGRCADGTCDVMVQNYAAWANAHPAEADKLGREVGVPAVTAMFAATEVPEAAGLVGVLRVAGRYVAGRIASTVTRRAAAAKLAENVAKGKAGEAVTRAKLGDKIAGEQVTFRTSDGTHARPDFVTIDKDIVESKTGGADLSHGQAKLKADVDAGRQVTPVGRNASKAGLEPGRPTTMRSCTIDRSGC